MDMFRLSNDIIDHYNYWSSRDTKSSLWKWKWWDNRFTSFESFEYAHAGAGIAIVDSSLLGNDHSCYRKCIPFNIENHYCTPNFLCVPESGYRYRSAYGSCRNAMRYGSLPTQTCFIEDLETSRSTNLCPTGWFGVVSDDFCFKPFITRGVTNMEAQR